MIVKKNSNGNAGLMDKSGVLRAPVPKVFEPGPELDAYIAEGLMGYRMVKVTAGGRKQELVDPNGYAVVVYDGGKANYIGFQKRNLPSYSTDERDLWPLVARLAELTYGVAFEPSLDGWLVRVSGGQYFKGKTASAAVAALAVCVIAKMKLGPKGGAK